MSAFEVRSFAAFASLLLAARSGALDPEIPSLTEIARNEASLGTFVRGAGLGPTAREMAARAAEAEAFTHAGPARDDAMRLFWQVAPEAFSDPGAFAGATLDPEGAVDRMVAAIGKSGLAHDFSRTVLAERYFREVASAMLAVMADEERAEKAR